MDYHDYWTYFRILLLLLSFASLSSNAAAADAVVGSGGGENDSLRRLVGRSLKKSSDFYFYFYMSEQEYSSSDSHEENNLILTTPENNPYHQFHIDKSILYAPPSDPQYGQTSLFYRYVSLIREMLHPYLESVGVDTARIEGNTAFHPNKAVVLQEIYRRPSVTKICEIGFNSGHSTLNALVASQIASVTSFDIGLHLETYLQHAYDVIDYNFPDRVELILGDSKVTVPEYVDIVQKNLCDTLFIDGDHTYSGALADIVNMRPLANKSSHVLIIDDVEDPSVAQAVEKAVAMKILEDGGEVIDSYYCDEYKFDDKNDQLEDRWCKGGMNGQMLLTKYI